MDLGRLSPMAYLRSCRAGFKIMLHYQLTSTHDTPSTYIVPFIVPSPPGLEVVSTWRSIAVVPLPVIAFTWPVAIDAPSICHHECKSRDIVGGER